MALSRMIGGMRGVYLAAAELSRRGYIATPTARNARAADLLVSDADCKRAFSVQVKCNSTKFNNFLLGSDSGETRSDSHIYVFINCLPGGTTEYFVVPSKKLGKIDSLPVKKGGRLYGIRRRELLSFQDKWEEAFGASSGSL